jgi:hypothetical protein
MLGTVQSVIVPVGVDTDIIEFEARVHVFAESLPL